MSEETKEVHIKTYDEWLKYYKNATKEQVIEDLTQDVKYFADAVKDIKELQNKLQQKENKEKEIREYIEKNWISQKDADNYRFDDEELDIEISDIAVLFDILDKEVNRL